MECPGLTQRCCQTPQQPLGMPEIAARPAAPDAATAPAHAKYEDFAQVDGPSRCIPPWLTVILAERRTHPCWTGSSDFNRGRPSSGGERDERVVS